MIEGLDSDEEINLMMMLTPKRFIFRVQDTVKR